MATLTLQQAHDIVTMAHKIGTDAARAVTPRPMHIAGYAPILDGVCGFAWVHIKGNTALGRLISKEIRKAHDTNGFSQWNEWNGFTKNSVGGGFQLWVSYFGQSYERKRAYAQAFAKHLSDNGHPAYAGSRLD